MGKNKLQRFAENATFSTIIEPPFGDVFHNDHPLKGHWQDRFTGVHRPITLELGCGRGEYTLALAQRFPDRNFIGVDIKGARLWYGAKMAHTQGMPNVLFLRTRIEVIGSFFAPGELQEIWITFPDPQLKSRREKKRLTALPFLERYRKMLSPTGILHLKTDSLELHEYTLRVLEEAGAKVHFAVRDIDPYIETYPELAIRTKYEEHFRGQGKPITYIRFSLDTARPLADCASRPGDRESPDSALHPED